MKRESIKEGMSRRQFMAFSGWVALGAATIGTPVSADVMKFSPELHLLTSGRLTMGTYVNMMLFHPSKDQGEEAMERAYEEMHRLIAIFDCHDDATPISYLNKTGSLNDLAPELHYLLNTSLGLNQQTRGAFDITIKPLLDLYEKSFKESGKPPEKEEIAGALQGVGCDGLMLDQRKAGFKRERMLITLDGIAKGYIVDRTMDVLRSHGVRHALINAGGDICVSGSRGDGTPWRIAIQDPSNPAKTIDEIEMTQGAVATSGNYEVFFDSEKLYHHLIKPRYGMPAGGVASVSIMAQNAMTADALSTSVFVMGMGKGKAFLKGHSGVGGLMIGSDQRRFSANWPKRA